MKLRNKKTGEIGKLHCDMNVSPAKYSVFEDTDIRGHYWEYDSLTELNSEWEDVPEEPKEYWFIYENGSIGNINWNNGEQDNLRKSIGNYFETKEEAEQALEKLKVWKRMKDTGCEAITWRWKQDYPNDACYVEVVLKCRLDAGVHDRELDLLFGGKE